MVVFEWCNKLQSQLCEVVVAEVPVEAATVAVEEPVTEVMEDSAQLSSSPVISSQRSRSHPRSSNSSCSSFFLRSKPTPAETPAEIPVPTLTPAETPTEIPNPSVVVPTSVVVPAAVVVAISVVVPTAVLRVVEVDETEEVEDVEVVVVSGVVVVVAKVTV